MNMEDWAENEVRLACKKENPDWDGKSFDYGCSCYQSALKAYKSLCGDDHSGMSFAITRGILIKLMKGIPLSPITDADFSEEGQIAHGFKEPGLKSDLQCPRRTSLFRTETLDGKVTYTDNDRVRFHDANGDSWWHSRTSTKMVDEMFPITMPYVPTDKPYEVFGETFYMEGGVDKTKENRGSYNLVKIYYIVDPYGNRTEVNKEFEL